jgi:hypothetical protein
MIAYFYAIFLLLISATPAFAEPISIAIVSAITGSAAAAGSFAVSAVSLGLSLTASLGLTLLSKALAPSDKPKPKAGETLSGVEFQVQIGGDIARQIVIGKCGVKGQLIYQNTNGSNNDSYQKVFVLSDWSSEQLTAVYVDGKRKNVFVLSSDVNSVTYSVEGYLQSIFYLRFYRGTQTTADATLIANANPAGRWDSNSVLKGMSYVIAFFAYQKDEPLYENGIPELMFEMEGARLYDWRYDSTNGGSGSQRWDDTSTWVYTDNPFVAIYNYIRGFHVNDERLIGMGVQPYDILHTTFTAAANACEESVTLDAGGSEQRYRCSTMLSADEGITHAQSLDALLSTAAGYLYDYAGYYYAQAGVAQSVSDTITDAELVVGATVTYAAKRSRSDLVNRVHGQYLDPVNYESQSYGAQVDSGAAINDNEELGRSLDLLSVPSRTQAERIAKIRLRESRAQATAKVTLGFNHVDKQAGDWITWTSARFGTKTWRIVDRIIDPITRTVSLDLVETNSAVYQWNSADEAVANAAPIRIEPGGRISTVSGFTVQATTITGGDSKVWPALKFNWTPVVDTTVDSVVIEYRIFGTTAASRISDFTPEDGQHYTTDYVVGGSNYEARATITTTPARVTTWTAWTSQVTTAAADLQVTIDDLVDEAPDIPAIATITSWIETLATGETQSVVQADWPDVGSSNLDSYTVELKVGAAGNYIAFQTDLSIYQWRGIPPASAISVRQRSRSALGNISGYSPVATHTVAGNTTPPGAIINLTGSGAFQTVFLNWELPTDKDIKEVEIWERATVNNRAGATIVARVTGTSAHLTGKTPGTTYYYWLRTVNTSGIPATNYTPSGATAGFAVTTASLAMTDFGLGIKPVIITSNLSSITSPVEGQTAYLTTDDKLYRYTGSAWTTAVPTVDLVGTITNAQIDTVASTKVTGTLTDAQLAAISAAKITGQITTTQITDNAITAAKITANTITAAEIAAGAITTDELATNAVTAIKINAGAVETDKLAANSVTALKIAANTITAAEIAANAITTDELAANAVTAVKINANAVESDKIAANAITAGKIDTNAVTAAKIQAGAIVAEKLAIGTYAANLAPNPSFEDSITPWVLSTNSGGTVAHVTGQAYAGNGAIRITKVSGGSNYTAAHLDPVNYIPVEPSTLYELSGAYKGNNSSSGGFSIRIDYYNSSKTSIGQVTVVSNLNITTSYIRGSVAFTTDAAAKFVDIVILNDTTSTATIVDVDEISLRRGLGATIIQDGSITTPKMVANSIDGDRIQANTLDAAKVKASTILSNTIIVEASGLNMGNITALAADPAARVNAHTTAINPGKILVAGATYLSDWRNGTDLTKIEGGSIAANTIAANKVTVGNRGIAITGLEFQVAKATGIVSWSTGIVSYINDSGNAVEDVVGASSYNTGGTFHYFYWTKGGGSVSYTTSAATAYGASNVVLATYGGTSALNVFYGNTIIDGDRILTNTIHANRIQANTITATELASSTLITAEAQIGNLTVGNLKIIDGAISNTNATVSLSTSGTNSSVLTLRGGSSVIISYFAHPYNGTSTYTGFNNLSFRTYNAQIYNTGGLIYDTGALAIYDVCIGAQAGPSFTWQANSFLWALEWTPPSDANYQMYLVPSHSWSMMYGISVIELDK